MCLPPISVWYHMMAYDSVHLEGHENYQKRSYRNRFYIATKQGKLCCSIPLSKGKNKQKPIRDITISYDTTWDKLLVRTLKSAYGSAPYFVHYEEDLSAILLAQTKYLWDLNTALIQWVMESVGIRPSIATTSSYQKEYQEEDIADMRGSIVKSAHDEIIDHRTYPQVFEDMTGFIPDLSIIDLIMCLGPEAINIIKNK
jgi:WbqC-like protein family.